MGEILLYVIVGLVVGIIARALLPGRDPIGILGTIVVGIVGAIIGGYLFSVIIPANDDGGVAWIGSVIVAMAMLYLYRRFAAGRGGTYNRV